MTHSYPISIIILFVAMFHGQLLATEASITEKVTKKIIVQSEQSCYSGTQHLKKIIPVTMPELKPLIKKFSLTTDSEPLKNAKLQKKHTQSKDEQFIPSEAISEDLSVSFPIDI